MDQDFDYMGLLVTPAPARHLQIDRYTLDRTGNRIRNIPTTNWDIWLGIGGRLEAYERRTGSTIVSVVRNYEEGGRLKSVFISDSRHGRSEVLYHHRELETRVAAHASWIARIVARSVADFLRSELQESERAPSTIISMCYDPAQLSTKSVISDAQGRELHVIRCQYDELSRLLTERISIGKDSFGGRGIIPGDVRLEELVSAKLISDGFATRFSYDAAGRCSECVRSVGVYDYERRQFEYVTGNLISSVRQYRVEPVAIAQATNPSEVLNLLGEIHRREHCTSETVCRYERDDRAAWITRTIIQTKLSSKESLSVRDERRIFYA